MSTRQNLFRRMSLKYIYSLSSLGIVLIACSVVGLLLYFASTRELMHTNERQMAEKLESFANYLETQRDVLENISYDIAVKIYYKKSFYKRNAYYELELLNEFVKYKKRKIKKPKKSIQFCDEYDYFVLKKT